MLSRGLLRTLIPTWHAVPCLGTSLHGDERLRDCIRALGIRMRTVPHFHQMDMVRSRVCCIPSIAYWQQLQ